MDSPFAFNPPFWDFDTIEDKLSDHLPTSLTRKSLGFSLVGFVFYILMFAALGTIMWRLRFSVRATYKWITRYASKGRSGNGGSVPGRKFTTDSYAMEEGQVNGGVFTSPRSSPRSSLSSPRPGSTFKSLQRFNLGLLPGSSTPSHTPRPVGPIAAPLVVGRRLRRKVDMYFPLPIYCERDWSLSQDQKMGAPEPRAQLVYSASKPRQLSSAISGDPSRFPSPPSPSIALIWGHLPVVFTHRDRTGTLLTRTFQNRRGRSATPISRRHDGRASPAQ